MQEPLVSFQSTDELRSALWPPSVPPTFNFDPRADAFQKLVQKGLPPIVSIRAMGVILGVNPKLITAMARFPERHYREFTIRKKSGGERTILAPRVFLKTVQRYILHSILETQDVPTHVNGFVCGRGIVANAQTHRGAKYLLNVDIANFFESIREETVSQLFLNLDFAEHVVKTLVGLCTYRGSLPQGAPTSPYLANLAFAAADGEIVQLSAALGFHYSRYADDLTFSGRERIPRQFLTRLELLLAKYGFRLNSEKTRFSGPGQAHYVTGLVVNEKAHPARDVRRRLRAMFHQAETYPTRFVQRFPELLGWASFVNSYDRGLGEQYLTVARRINPHS